MGVAKKNTFTWIFFFAYGKQCSKVLFFMSMDTIDYLIREQIVYTDEQAYLMKLLLKPWFFDVTCLFHPLCMLHL